MGKLIAITGPSGSGKSTIAKILKDKYDIPEMVSYTTRPARKGEIDGISYHFVTKEQFTQIPMAEKAEYNGNWYGTALHTIEECIKRDNYTCIVCEIEGVRQLKTILGNENLIQVFVESNKNTLLRRLINRGDNQKDIKKRLDAYEKDIEMKKYAHYIIKNNDNLINLSAEIDKFYENLFH